VSELLFNELSFLVACGLLRDHESVPCSMLHEHIVFLTRKNPSLIWPIMCLVGR